MKQNKPLIIIGRSGKQTITNPKKKRLWIMLTQKSTAVKIWKPGPKK